MEWKEIVIVITVILGVFAMIGILYDAWSGLRNAGTNSEEKREIKKDMIRNIVFGAIILVIILSLESWILFGVLG